MRFTKQEYTYEGEESLPNSFWKQFFSMSTIGNTYTVLIDSEPISYPANFTNEEGQIIKSECFMDLVMCDTEYESYTNDPFFTACLEYESPKVLSVGYGLGFIVPEMQSQNADLTVIEKEQEIIDLEDDIDPSITIIVDDINTMDLSSLGPYDVIFCDTTETITNPERLEALLNEDGKLIHWKHRKVTTE